VSIYSTNFYNLLVFFNSLEFSKKFVYVLDKNIFPLSCFRNSNTFDDDDDDDDDHHHHHHHQSINQLIINQSS